MTQYDEWRSELEQFENIRANEIKWNPIEKWLTEFFGATRVKGTRGSHVIFEHPQLAKIRPPGRFQVALKKNKIIYRDNLRTLCRRLHQIIDLIEEEEHSA